jgi:protein involved in polysaccharide export with SLBB domain
LNCWRFTLLLALATCGEGLLPAQSQQAVTNQPAALSVSASGKRAAWQQRLTLGPGDTLNISLFEAPDSLQKEIPVGPDGRVNFLQAHDVVAAGLTIDEFRAKLDAALGKFYQSPRTIVTPVSYSSKKYFVLGAVANKGVYNLDRPMTVVEAIARAGGLETGLHDTKTIELADLPRSFLVRDGQRLPVDFEKLFQQGDLTQNVALEPGDYLYFASADANEISVLGEVALPGTVPFAQRTTVISVISARGGFSDKAFKSRVLVVRGSLNHPETFAVNTADIIHGKAPDFKLQPKDIVYVSANPWLKVEDLLDTAARAFLQGMIVQWTTLNVGPIITSPLLH